MIPYLIALVGGYLIGESMQENETFASGGILDSDVKDNVSDFLVHKTNSEDFDVYIDNSVSPAEVTITSNAYDETEMQDFLAEANQALFDNDGTIEYNSVKGPLPEFLMHVMADGGKVTFQDKVNAVASRLIGTEVPKRLQGDYGKTYNKEEAFLAAKRIIGAQRAKYGESKSKQGKLFNKGGMVTVKTELNHTIEKLSPKQKKVYESRLQRMKADERFESLTDRDMADYVNGWYGEDIVTNMDFSGKQSFDLGMKVLAMYEAQKEPAFWEEELMIAKDGGKTKSYKNIPPDMKIAGKYSIKIGDDNFETNIGRFERAGDDTDALAFDLDEYRVKYGSIHVKNSDMPKISKGKEVKGFTSKGNKDAKIKRIVD